MKSLRFALLSDTHWTADPDAGDSRCWNRTLRSQSLALLPALCDSIREQGVDFILHLGDLTDDGRRESLEAGLGALSALGVPVYWVRGNHDGEEISERLRSPGTGEGWSSFTTGEWLFLLLDNTLRECELDPACADRRRRLLQSEQREWLTGTLRRHPNKRTVVCSHLPLVTRPRYEVRTDPDGEPVSGMTGEAVGKRIGWSGDGEEILSTLYREGRPSLLLSGHWHIFDLLRHGNTPCVSVPSVVEFPCEYLICELRDHDLTLSRRPSGVDPALSLIREAGNLFPAGDGEREYRLLL